MKRIPAPKLTEAQLHLMVARYLAIVLKPPVVWTTIGHGGGGKARGAQMKARGLHKGWPDILILAPGPRLLGIELKSKTGKISEEQRAMEAAFHECQAWYVTCWSLDDVKAAIRFCHT